MKKYTLTALSLLTATTFMGCGAQGGKSSGPQAADMFLGDTDSLSPEELAEREAQAEVDRMLEERDLLQTDLDAQAGDLERERDRRGKISNMMATDDGPGCRLFTELTAIELRINGENVGTKKHDKQGRKDPVFEELARSIGSGSTMNFEFGSGFVLSNSESSNSIFQPTGQLISTNYQDLTIDDFDGIKISKSAVSAEFDENCRQVLIFPSCKGYAIESDRFQLNSLEIRITDDDAQQHVLYRAEGLDHLFEFGSMEWEAKGEFSLKENAAYLKLMSESNCSANG